MAWLELDATPVEVLKRGGNVMRSTEREQIMDLSEKEAEESQHAEAQLAASEKLGPPE